MTVGKAQSSRSAQTEGCAILGCAWAWHGCGSADQAAPAGAVLKHRESPPQIRPALMCASAGCAAGADPKWPPGLVRATQLTSLGRRFFSPEADSGAEWTAQKSGGLKFRVALGQSWLLPAGTSVWAVHDFGGQRAAAWVVWHAFSIDCLRTLKTELCHTHSVAIYWGTY